MSSPVRITDLLSSKMHWGHQVGEWNPKMRGYIWGQRMGHHVIDLVQTQSQLEGAVKFLETFKPYADRPAVKNVLFVGTKVAAQDAIWDYATSIHMPYVKHRWLGGMLTNWETIQKRVEHMRELRIKRETGTLDLLGNKERRHYVLQLAKLEQTLGGLADMRRLPDALVIVDLKKEHLAVREAKSLKIPIIALTDTNCNPDDADFVVAGNDDALSSCSLFLQTLAKSFQSPHLHPSDEGFADHEPRNP